MRFGWIHVRSVDRPWHITGVRVVSQVKPTNYAGSFSCSDELLNRIWYTGAYSVKANLYTDYFGAILMDRGDRYAWAGDCHPDQAAALVAFDNRDFVRENLSGTAGVSNGIESYPLYWVLSLLDYHDHTGDTATLRRFATTAASKLDHGDAIFADPTITFYGHDERLGACFEAPNRPETKSAYRMLLIGACRRFADAMEAIGEDVLAATYRRRADARAAEVRADPDWHETLGIHALSDAINAGCVEEDEQAAIVEREFADRLNRLSYSPFNQYFILQALARLGRYEDALVTVRDQWGGQLDYGGTLFFEVFRPDWLSFREQNDRPPDCQVGYTSLGHAWGAGVTAWLSHEILGIRPTSPGFATFDVVPHLDRTLTWVRGTMPTPRGEIRGHFDVDSGRCDVHVPRGTIARIGLPAAGADIDRVTVDGRLVWDGAFHGLSGIGGAEAGDGHVYLTAVQPGDWRIKVRYRNRPRPSSASPEPFRHPVRFIGEDTTTAGDWGGRYGSQGYVLFDYDGAGRDHARLPSFVRSVTPAATRAYGNCARGQWTAGTNERRALAPDGSNTTPRNLGVVYSTGWPMGMTMSVDIDTADGAAYRLGLYVIDWDRQNRQQVVEVFDLRTLKLVAPVRLVEEFAEGKYLLYQCDRAVRLRFDHLHGDNAVLNAVFFDPAGA